MSDRSAGRRPARHIVVAITAYTGTIHLATNRCLLNDMIGLMMRGDTVSIIDELGNGELSKARAMQLAKFLEVGGTHLMMVDWDVSWQPNAIAKLVDHGVDFVAGAYPFRKLPLKYPIQLIDGKKVLTPDPVTHLCEVQGIPAGFVCLSRRMVERMHTEYGDTKFWVNPWEDGEPRVPGNTAYHVFGDYRIKHDPAHLLSEDYAFCARWRDIGGKVWLDPDIAMAHTGPQTFGGVPLGEWKNADAKA